MDAGDADATDADYATYANTNFSHWPCTFLFLCVSISSALGPAIQWNMDLRFKGPLPPSSMCICALLMIPFTLSVSSNLRIQCS